MFKRDDFLAIRHVSLTKSRLTRLVPRSSTSNRCISQRLRSRFSRMFSGWHLGMTLFRGWDRILATACEEISNIVPGELDFHWVQIEEREGMLHLFYSIGEWPQYVVEIAPPSHRVASVSIYAPARGVVEHIDAIVEEAERLSAEACIVCGLRAARAEYFGRTLPICDLHRPIDLNLAGEEGLSGLWRAAIDWEEGLGRRPR